MKKFLFGILAVSALTLSSCSEDNDTLNNVVSGATTGKGDSSEKVSFTAAIEQNDGSTRTTVDIANGTGTIKWATGDAISVLNTGGTFDNFTLTAGAGSTTAIFEGNFTEGTEAGAMAVYPAGAHKYEGGTLTVNLPATYGSTETEYTPNTNVLMLAQMSGGEEIYFKHLGGVLYFDVKVPAGSTSVSFTGKGICGDFTVDMSGENPVIAQKADAEEQTVTYRFKAFETEKTVTFYIPVPTGDYEEFKIDVATDTKGGGGYAKFVAAKTLERRTIAKLQSLTDVALYEWVDLGLPSGTLWATCNVGATSTTEYGNYYAWGDTEAMTSPAGADWAVYKFGNFNTLTKYVLKKYSSYGDGGYYDDNTVLDNGDDVAVAEWGGKWHMPTYEEMEELMDNTTSILTTKDGISGFELTSNINSNKVFFPAGGLYADGEVSDLGTIAIYWSSTLRQNEKSYNANTLCIQSEGMSLPFYVRKFGMNVRPVRSK